MGDTVYIPHPEYCDLCKSKGEQVQAVYDGKTIHGPWAYMCEDHFGALGVGLGTGRGQRLIVGEKPSPEQRTSDGITEVEDDEDEGDVTIASNVSNDIEPSPEMTTTESADRTEPSDEETSVAEVKETPAQKRRRLRAARRKQSFQERMVEADYKRTNAAEETAPSSAREEIVEEQVPYVMKMDWGDPR